MADKLTLPKANFKRELTPAAVDPTMKAAEATTGKLYRVPVGKLQVIPGFNLRVETPDYIAHRDSIQASIAANGFNQKKPLSGYVGHEGDEDVIFITDGHTRLAAVQAYNEAQGKKGEKITHLPVLVAPKDATMTDLLVELHTANNGRELSPFEKGVLVKRLIGEGLDKKDIAARLGFTTRYLDDVLLLANADAKVKRHVASGDVSSTMAIQLLRKDADSAAEKIEAAVTKAAKTGKAKATKKDTAPKTQKVKVQFNYSAGQDMKEIVKAAAGAIRDAIPAEEGEEDTKLSTVKGFVTVIVELPATEKAKVEKPAKPAKKVAAKKAKVEDAEEAAEPKPAKKKVTAKKATAKKPKAKPPVEGAEEIEETDDEVAILPPKVESDPDVPDDEEVDI